MAQIVIAYVPALHRGYIDFFKKYSDGIYILDLSLVREVPRLERDIRALTASEAQSLVRSLGIFKEVKVLTKDALASIPSDAEIVMPDEDVSHAFAETYVKDRKIHFIPVFLRWDRPSALKDTLQPNPDRKISQEKFDKEIMGKAVAEGQKSSDWWRQVGSIVTKGKEIILIGHNKPLPSEGVHNIFGDPRSNFDYGVSFELSKFLHAEAGLIAEAARRGISLEGTSIYVSTFPCPVCAKSIAVTGIKKVYYKDGYSLLDAEDILKGAGIDLIQVKMD